MLQCQYRKKVWLLVERIINKALGLNIKLNRLEILTGYFKTDIEFEAGVIINFCLSMTRYAIWLNRNSIRNDQVVISFEECYLKLKHFLLGQIKIIEMSKKPNQK